MADKEIEWQATAKPENGRFKGVLFKETKISTSEETGDVMPNTEFSICCEHEHESRQEAEECAVELAGPGTNVRIIESPLS